MNASNSLARREDNGQLAELVLIQGDLSRLKPEEKTTYYVKVCESLGLNYLTRPFEYLKLNGKEILYARRDATDQLRQIHSVTITIAQRERVEDVYVVTARATLPNGRADESTGAVPLGSLKGEALANALMKAETKAKRRVTLSICGLSMLDETELETLPAAQPKAERGNISPHLDPDENWTDTAPVDGPFDAIMAQLVALETKVDVALEDMRLGNGPSYHRVVTLRDELGSKAKPTSALCVAMQRAREDRTCSPDQRKALGQTWQRTDRKIGKLEAVAKPPSAEELAHDDPEDFER